MSPSPYALDEPAYLIHDEVAWLQGAFLGSLLCGVQITLSAMSFLAVLKQRMRRCLRIALLVYIFLLCVIMTAGQETSLVFVQMGFIQWRDYPGGPNGYLSYQYSTPLDLASTTLFMCANWMMESLLVWRCKVVCSTGERPMWIGVVVPSVLLISQYIIGGMFLHRMLRGGYMVTYSLIYSSLSLALNITVTGIIAGRLLVHRRRVVRQFGSGHGAHYAGVVAILVESAALYTCFLILVIIIFSVGTPAENILQQVAAQVQCITSLLIIYRIAKGKGWNDDAVVSSMEWRGDTDTETRTVHEVVHPELAPDPARAGGIHGPRMLDKEETPPSPIDMAPTQTCVV